MPIEQLTARFLPHAELGKLLLALADRGYCCVGPQVEDGVIVLRELSSDEDLPRGIRSIQVPGSYRLAEDREQRYFAWTNGPQGLKPWLFAPEEPIWRSVRADAGQLGFAELTPPAKPLAVIGVRACDLAGLAIQDAHFLGGPSPDAHYARRREGLFLVAVQCAEAAATCFCASTGDGPAPGKGFDLALVELSEGFVASAGSDEGAQVLSALNLAPATAAQQSEGCRQAERAAQMQTRTLPSRDLRQSLLERLEHPRWDEVASRCLACGNCTAVCPTCFCHAHEVKSELGTDAAEQVRKWDSCFGESHGQLHGFQVRSDTRGRYRQWLVHKLGTWHEQFGRSGCVGCGRCIAWCPVGIDLTEEAAALMEEA
ncbi:MAG TPA: 4Fe-4S dicluster domain-containing protein [Thiobacillaceae bacterium]|nr:4Fe-4S dicluster domain-containing protein [Thiobacillaceae bacterium]